MKQRAACLFLAVLALLTCIAPAYAAEGEGAGEQPEAPVESETVEAEQELEETEAPVVFPVSGDLCFDSVVAPDVERENVDGTVYVTVRSFVTLVDPEAMVEESNGFVSVSTSTVTAVEDAGEGQAGVETETLTLNAKSGNTYIEANGRCLFVVNGVRTINGAVAVPVRILGKVFNLGVWFNADTGVVYVAHRANVPAYLTSGEEFYDADSLYWLSHIINAESANQSLNGKIAVGNVVMNRVASPLFPNNIHDVIFQRNQFTPVYNGAINRTPTAASVVAAKLVMEGVTIVPSALFFNLAGTVTYASMNRTYVTTIGAHAFYK